MTNPGRTCVRPLWLVGFPMLALTALSGSGCGGGGGPVADAGGRDGAAGDVASSLDGPEGLKHLRINELCPDDDGFLIDEHGHTDDWIELRNGGPGPVGLAGLSLALAGGRTHVLPAITVRAGETIVFWADGAPEQGVRHLSFRLPASGGRVLLRDPAGQVIDELAYPALPTNEAFARFPDGTGPAVRCRYASPARPNGDRCGPPPPPGLPEEVRFAPYVWPAAWGSAPGPLAISEAALFPAGFVEVINQGTTPISPAAFELRLSPHAPGDRWPGPAAGMVVPWPDIATLAPGERLVVPLTPALTETVSARPEREGVLTIFSRTSAVPSDRLDFLRVPDGGVLARSEEGPAPGPALRLCSRSSPGAPNATCDPVEERPVGDRLRHIRTPGDLRALGEGSAVLDGLAVKFVVDMDAGDVVHFIANRVWPLHYTFIREAIFREPHLDRCDPREAPVFDAAWRAFSEREYFTTDRRRFLLGTLVRHGGSGLQTVEFDRADEITGAQMRRAFFAVVAHLPDPRDWAVRAQGARQVTALKAIEGTVPALEPNAPFRGITFQPITPGIGYGVLKFVPAAELGEARLGPDVIVVTDDVPNDVPLVGGLVTEAFQTPLSHVAILTRNRGTPDMALTGARQDARIAPFLGKLVRLEVSGAGFTLQEATPAEAQAFWDKRRPRGERFAPRLDTTVRGLQDLRQRGLPDLPAIGAKAAQLAELMHLVSVDPECPGPVPTPPVAFALPVVHGMEHFEASGARALLTSLRADPTFTADPRVRAVGLARVRQLIEAHPVDAGVEASITALARQHFGARRFRLRSSSNAEDLPTFSGAGLYTSVSAAVGDPERPVDRGLRTVWASLWSERAYDERELALIDQDRVAMGVLIHEAYHQVERANGVAVSRDVRNPLRWDVHSINVQAGEASVTNPAPGVTSDELTYTSWLPSPVVYMSRSNLVPNPVLNLDEIRRVGCFMRTVHAHFRARLDPEAKHRWFTMESEFKLVGPQRMLLFKQARPYSFGPLDVPADCREI